MTLAEAHQQLADGKINGIAVGERVCAKRDTYVVRDDGLYAKRITRGTHLISTSASRSSLGFELEGAHWSGNKKSFMTFPDGKVVLKVWK